MSQIVGAWAGTKVRGSIDSARSYQKGRQYSTLAAVPASRSQDISYRGEPLYHASLAPEEYRTLLKSTGFRVVAHIVEDPNCGRHTIWLAQAEP
jgi:hypothetical protein